VLGGVGCVLLFRMMAPKDQPKPATD